MAFYNEEKRSGYGGPKKFGNKGGFEKRGGGFDRGGRGGFGGQAGGRAAMFDATCSQCGNDCQVPFRPNGHKPVFCSVCFGKQGGGADRGGERSFGRPSFGGRGDFKPRDFQPDRNSQTGENLKEQFEKMNRKLDRVLDLLMKHEQPVLSVETEEKEDEKDRTPLIVKKAKKTAKTKKK